MQDGAPQLQVLDRAFAVLDLFGADQPECGTSEVARAADCRCRLRAGAPSMMTVPLGLQVPELVWP